MVLLAGSFSNSSWRDSSGFLKFQEKVLEFPAWPINTVALSGWR